MSTFDSRSRPCRISQKASRSPRRTPTPVQSSIPPPPESSTRCSTRTTADTTSEVIVLVRAVASLATALGLTNQLTHSGLFERSPDEIGPEEVMSMARLCESAADLMRSAARSLSLVRGHPDEGHVVQPDTGA